MSPRTDDDDDGSLRSQSCYAVAAMMTMAAPADHYPVYSNDLFPPAETRFLGCGGRSSLFPHRPDLPLFADLPARSAVILTIFSLYCFGSAWVKSSEDPFLMGMVALVEKNSRKSFDGGIEGTPIKKINGHPNKKKAG